MIAKILLVWATAAGKTVLTGARRHAAALMPHMPVLLGRGSELAGFGCAAVFLHQVWAPLVWAAAAAVLILAGQRR
jgi:hypothetical protein